MPRQEVVRWKARLRKCGGGFVTRQGLFSWVWSDCQMDRTERKVRKKRGKERGGCWSSGRTSAGLQLLFAMYVAHAGLKLMAIPLALAS